MKSTRYVFSNDMVEHQSILKNDQRTYYPPLSFTLKTGIAFRKTGTAIRPAISQGLKDHAL